MGGICVVCENDLKSALGPDGVAEGGRTCALCADIPMGLLGKDGASPTRTPRESLRPTAERVYPPPQHFASVSRRSLLFFCLEWSLILLGPLVALVVAAAAFLPRAPDALAPLLVNLAIAVLFVLVEVTLIANAQGRWCNWRVRPTGRYHSTVEADWSNRMYICGVVVILANVFVLSLHGASVSCDVATPIGYCGSDWRRWRSAMDTLDPLPETQCRCVRSVGARCAEPIVLTCGEYETDWLIPVSSYPAEAACRRSFVRLDQREDTEPAVLLNVYCTDDTAANITIRLAPVESTPNCSLLDCPASETDDMVTLASLTCPASPARLSVPTTTMLVLDATADVSLTVSLSHCFARQPDRSDSCTVVPPPPPPSGRTATACDVRDGLVSNLACTSYSPVNCSNTVVGWRGRECHATVQGPTLPLAPATCSPSGYCLDGADGHGDDSACAVLHEAMTRVVTSCADAACARLDESCIPGTFVESGHLRDACWTNMPCGSCGPLHGCGSLGNCELTAAEAKIILSRLPDQEQPDCLWSAKVSCAQEPGSTSRERCNSVPPAIDASGSPFSCAWGAPVTDGVPPTAFDSAWYTFAIVHAVLSLAALCYVGWNPSLDAWGLVYPEDIAAEYTNRGL